MPSAPRTAFALVAVQLLALACVQGGCGTDTVAIPPGGDAGAIDGALPPRGDAAPPASLDGGARCAKDSDCPVGTLCTGGACAPGCHSGRDCPASKKVCDPSAGPSGACVECAQASDCPSGDTCVAGACAKTCTGDGDCPGQHCNTATHVCVDCLTKDQCPIGDVCASNACVPGCDGDRDCPAATPKCNASAPPHGACVQCLAKSDCGTGETCSNGACVKACSGDADCPGQHCDKTTQACVQCTDTTQCPLGNVCKSDACTPGCGGDRDCPPTTPRCDSSAGANGQCVECLGNGDCTGGATCKGGACVSSTGAPAMVSIPGGSFVMGSGVNQVDGGSNDTAPHTVTLSPYSIETLEVTNDAYRACVTARACAAPLTTTDYNDATKKAYPVTFVTWAMANDFCQWEGRRLPTEAEWEHAARGPADGTYPWGEAAATCTLTNGAANAGQPCVNALSATGTHKAGASAYGAEDMAGNAREWVEDWYTPYASSPTTDPHGPGTPSIKIARGGSWGSTDVDLTAYTRPQRDVASNDGYIGFRCAKSAGTVAAAFTASSTNVLAAQAVTFDASGSSDPIDPGSALQVRWDFDDDGTWDTAFATTKTVTHAFSSPGTFTVVLEVQNTRGDTERALRMIDVAPTVGGDGSACGGDGGAACAAGYTCVSTQGVCRATCSGPGTACPVAGYTCQPDPSFPLPIYFVCLPP